MRKKAYGIILKVTGFFKARWVLVGEICKDMGQVFFATLFLQSLLNGEVRWLGVVSGFILAIGCWMISLILNKV